MVKINSILGDDNNFLNLLFNDFYDNDLEEIFPIEDLVCNISNELDKIIEIINYLS